MLQGIEQTRDEKIAMYMKLTKRELVEMVINCNDLLMTLPARTQELVYTPSPMFSFSIPQETTTNSPY